MSSSTMERDLPEGSPEAMEAMIIPPPLIGKDMLSIWLMYIALFPVHLKKSMKPW